MNFKSRLVPLYMVGCRIFWIFLVYAFRVIYFYRVRRIRRKLKKGERIEVLFLVSVTSKWKCQSLFDAMKKSDIFRPRIAVALQRRELEEMKPAGDYKAIRARIEGDVRFFRNLGNETVLACNLDTMDILSLRNFNPDIVFFQEPGAPIGRHRVTHEGWHSLCCYIPYSVEFFSDTTKSVNKLHWQNDFHKLMHLIIQWSNTQARHCYSGCSKWLRAGRVVGLGSPIFDSIQSSSKESKVGYVVYAPHFSFPLSGVKRAFNIGTFLDNGHEILQYAQKHPEMKWVFKPHPLMAWTLVNQAGWTRHEVEEYYKAWEKIGIGCYDGSYPQIFRESKALITDSGSFLCEYSVTGMPLIHLAYPSVDKIKVIPEMEPLLSSFYSVDNEKSMKDIFNVVLEKGEDPKKDDRLLRLKELGVWRVNAAENIVDYMKKEFCEK